MYSVSLMDGSTEEHYGRPIVTDSVLHIVKYTGGISTGEREDSRVSFSLVNVKTWRKVRDY